jgi:hypothetical protein
MVTIGRHGQFAFELSFSFINELDEEEIVKIAINPDRVLDAQLIIVTRTQVGDQVA